MKETPCTTNPKLFFPTPNRDDKSRLMKDDPSVLQAKSLCDTCSTRISCLDSAIDNREYHGIWGGVHFGNPTERRMVLRSRMRAQ